MPELPEVEAIAGVAARHCIGQQIMVTRVRRQPKNEAYFGNGLGMFTFPTGATITRVYRRGKHVLFELQGGGAWIDCHNAMTGYWDYVDDPWTFDYVEGPRNAADHVRVQLCLENGRVLQFHDARFFGRLQVVYAPPQVGPELINTPHGLPGAPVVTLPDFARWILGEPRPVKVALMDQSRLAGIGNIYANEACHVAGIDPSTPGQRLDPSLVPALLEALRYVVDLRIPDIDYSSLLVYRRADCGSCGSSIVRTELAKRSTFSCPRCQS